VKSQISAGGKTMDPKLAGKWICPMHPDVVKDRPDICDVCEMKLERSEDLGLVSSKSVNPEPPLVIPATAPLITGKRAVVYVELPGAEGVYEGRNVVLGARAGDYYLVESGLEEGEKVVIRGNFKIDSAIQIKAGPSMMNPEGSRRSSGHDHNHGIKEQEISAAQSKEELFQNISETFVNQLDQVYLAYFTIQEHLSQDNLSDVKNEILQFSSSLEKVESEMIEGQAYLTWNQLKDELSSSIKKIKQTGQIDVARSAFEPLSEAIISTARHFGSNQHSLLVYHCPMAFDFKGANWLQSREGTANPYFGSAMFSCGDQVENLSTPALNRDKGNQTHEQ
jgi:Cu(I)/Ag(I) efflux system membrane fusion protein